MTHRLLITGALSEGRSHIRNPLYSQDTEATAKGISSLGVIIREKNGDWLIEGGTLRPPKDTIDCKESGTTLRLLTGLTSLLQAPVTLTGVPSLRRRPNKPILKALEQLGVKTESSQGHPPITVQGKMKGGEASIRGDVSSQYISSIILAAPYAESPVDLSITTTLESKPYVEMTIDAMKKAGIRPLNDSEFTKIHVPVGEYKPIDRRVEGDWSSAAYMLAAGVLAGKVHVDSLDVRSCQADREIVWILEEMGGYIKRKGNRFTSEKSMLSAIELDMSDCPDLFPVVSVLCAAARGTSTLTGLSRLRIKESDRVEAIKEGLHAMGIKMNSDESSAKITGGTPRGATINPHNDHRIAMSFAILAQIAENKTKIQNPDCVAKSYPGFWSDLENIGARIE